MNEEEIIELVEELKENCQCWLEDEDTCVDDRKWFEKEKIVLQNLLDLYNQEKEKNKKLEEELKCFRDGYEEARIVECDNYFMLNRIINLMAEDIKNNVNILFNTDKNIKNIKAYYFNKLKEKKR